MSPDLQSLPPWLLLIPVALIALAVARRVPVLGRLVSVAIWIGMAWLLVLVVGERGSVDPHLDRVMSMIGLDRQEVSGDELRIRMASDGHFWAKARINGFDRRMLVDSGATVTAVSTETAAAADMDVRNPVFPVVLQTANGNIPAQMSKITTLRIGNIVARDLQTVVSPAFGDTDVLGMNFLSKLKSWRVEGRTLILVPNHPQPPEPEAEGSLDRG